MSPSGRSEESASIAGIDIRTGTDRGSTGPEGDAAAGGPAAASGAVGGATQVGADESGAISIPANGPTVSSAVKAMNRLNTALQTSRRT
ncbi:hypothetical protein GCM10009835_31500 [Planosporangium flavigriseum]|uniref:Uncharacterized protein n=1 Tax=Planosporangium flavigriseum TaxID=373681 RepID=A0A8J3PMY6_9ACTN|nr:hypothetical protein Pfl04_18100 [Planosporangium flavigriseum]